MGNCSGRMKPIKLVSSKGELRLISAPTTAAELMLGSPGYAVAPLESLQVTRRITEVRAEDVLAPRKAYVMVPVDRVGCRVSRLQLAAVEKSVFGGGKGEARRRRMSGSKVLPEGGGCEEVEGVDVKSPALVVCGGGDLGGGCRRRGRNGSRGVLFLSQS